MVCVLHHLNLDFITHRYLQGMYAFGLVETNFYNEAEKYALKVELKPPCKAHFFIRSLASI